MSHLLLVAAGVDEAAEGRGVAGQRLWQESGARACGCGKKLWVVGYSVERETYREDVLVEGIEAVVDWRVWD